MSENPYVADPAYPERVYAGVLGKIIGVYLGRPFEGWSHERILEELGEVDRYVANELNVPLVVSDDDISGTFTFLRALADNGYDPNLTSAQIGDTWLNYLIEGKTVLWWGGIGMSTEHTAYLRLKEGIQAPESGSIEQNGRTVAEQIGAQIFIDGWGLINPGDPEEAVRFAKLAAQVSHDGEAVYAAQVIAALVAQAFVEKDVPKLLATALDQIPADCTIAKLIADVRSWYEEKLDWKEAFQKLKSQYGYDKYSGVCHVVPNHGVVILALLFGEGAFSKSLMIANTCGWDTDCNSGNVGCILGVLTGLEGIDAGYDWRGPVGDRILLPTADGGRCVTDAVRESLEIVKTAHLIRSMAFVPPKQGAKFSFAFPGSIQGFAGKGASLSHQDGGLRITLTGNHAIVTTRTVPTIEERATGGYNTVFSPTLVPGQRVTARLSNIKGPLTVALTISSRMVDQHIRMMRFNPTVAESGSVDLHLQAPDLGVGFDIAKVGLSLSGEPGSAATLEWLTWDGDPTITLRPADRGIAWADAWVSAVDDFQVHHRPVGVCQNQDTGLLIYGCREWQNLTVESDLFVYLAESVGLAVRVQGLARFYALRVTRDGKAQIVKNLNRLTVLAEKSHPLNFDERLQLELSVDGAHLVGSVNGIVILEVDDVSNPLQNGAIAIVVTEGRVGFDSVKITANE